MFPSGSVGFQATGGPVISQVARDTYDYDRLERVVRALVQVYRDQKHENAGLRRKLELSSGQVRSLEGQLLEANQLRQDVAKRVDELIHQLDHLESQLGNDEV